MPHPLSSVFVNKSGAATAGGEQGGRRGGRSMPQVSGSGVPCPGSGCSVTQRAALTPAGTLASQAATGGWRPRTLAWSSSAQGEQEPSGTGCPLPVGHGHGRGASWGSRRPRVSPRRRGASSLRSGSRAGVAPAASSCSLHRLTATTLGCAAMDVATSPTCAHGAASAATPGRPRVLMSRVFLLWCQDAVAAALLPSVLG